MLHQDIDVTAAELENARITIGLYADWFDTIRALGEVHPDWLHSLPSRGQILFNYTLLWRDYAQRMQSHVALDVAGGSVRVNYHSPRPHPPDRRWAAVPLKVYTRASGIGRTGNPTQVEADWRANEHSSQGKPFVAELGGRIEVLPIDFSYPRHIEARLRIERSRRWTSVFPTNVRGGLVDGLPPFSSSMLLVGGGEAIFTQLNVIISRDNKYYQKVASDSRAHGTPESAGMVHVLLRRVIPGQPDFVAILRIRNWQGHDANGVPTSILWHPNLSNNEPEPYGHRDGETVYTMSPPSTVLPSNAPIRHPLNYATVEQGGSSLNVPARPASRTEHQGLPSISDFVASVSGPNAPPRSPSHYHSFGNRQQGIYRKFFPG